MSKNRYEKQLREFDKMAAKMNLSTSVLRRNRIEYEKIFLERLKQSQRQLRQNKEQNAKFPEFLDYKLFYGSRITHYWNLIQNRQRLLDQIEDLELNNWPYKTPYEMHLELLEISDKARAHARNNIITDIYEQLLSQDEFYYPMPRDKECCECEMCSLFT